jgi:hypothetical protein
MTTTRAQDRQTQPTPGGKAVPDARDILGASGGASPVDDRTYNLLQALTSKLEAIDAYEQYAMDDQDGTFTELIEDERRHAERLLEALRRALAA